MYSLSIKHKNPTRIENIKLFLSMIIVLVVYSFGNFGVLNLFDAKLTVQTILILLAFIPIFIISFYHTRIVSYQRYIVMILLYSIFSSLILESYNILNLLQLSLSLMIVIALFQLSIKYIDFILKSIVTITFIFSILVLIQFIFLQVNPELINALDMRFSSDTKYINIDDSNAFAYLGFAVIGDIKTILGVEFVRLKSFASEPSVLVTLFYAVGIMGLFYSRKFRIMSFLILFVSIFIIYSGVMHLSLLFSVIFYLYIKLIKPSARRGSMFILFNIFLLFFLLTIIGAEYFTLAFVDASKEGSSLARLGGIIILFNDILSNPFLNLEIPIVPPTGFIINNSFIIPILGIYLSTKIFFNLFYCNMILFKEYKTVSILLSGMFIQVAFFSSYGWELLPGWIVLALIASKINNVARSNKFKTRGKKLKK